MNEEFKKNETVSHDNPGFNGNFDTLVPTEEECDKAAEKCKSAYRSLLKQRKYKIGGGVNVEENQEKE